MKKGKKWAQKEVDRYLSYEGVNEARNALVFAKGVINQLDEPEVLSQEWIRINQERKGVHFFVNVTKLQNLIVPKQEEITELDALNRLAHNVQFSADEIANHLEKLSAYNGQVTYGNQEMLSQSWIDEHRKSYTMEDSVEISDLQNLLVPKQEEITESFKETIRELIKTSELAMDVQKLTGMTLEEIKEESINGGIVPKQEEVDRAYKDGYEKGKEYTFYKGYLEGLADKEKEPETVASVIADFYKSFERFKEVISMEVEELEE